MATGRPAVFLDRDGVILVNRETYVRSWDDVAFLPGALDALARLAASPFAVVVVTNQAGIGKGLYTLETANGINERITGIVTEAGGRIDAVYLCPHRPDAGCGCRKPQPGMLRQAASEHDLCLARSWMIGDALTDLQAGEAAGTRTRLVLTGRGQQQARQHGLTGTPDLATALGTLPF